MSLARDANTLGRTAAEIATRLWRDIHQRHAAKLLARALGVSHATARLYVEQPYLVPPSRTEQILLALETAHAEQEQKTLARRKVLETLRGQLSHDIRISDTQRSLLAAR